MDNQPTTPIKPNSDEKIMDVAPPSDNSMSNATADGKPLEISENPNTSQRPPEPTPAVSGASPVEAENANDPSNSQDSFAHKNKSKKPAPLSTIIAIFIALVAMVGLMYIAFMLYTRENATDLQKETDTPQNIGSINNSNDTEKPATTQDVQKINQDFENKVDELNSLDESDPDISDEALGL